MSQPWFRDGEWVPTPRHHAPVPKPWVRQPWKARDGTNTSSYSRSCSDWCTCRWQKRLPVDAINTKGGRGGGVPFSWLPLFLAPRQLPASSWRGKDIADETIDELKRHGPQRRNLEKQCLSESRCSSWGGQKRDSGENICNMHCDSSGNPKTQMFMSWTPTCSCASVPQSHAGGVSVQWSTNALQSHPFLRWPLQGDLQVSQAQIGAVNHRAEILGITFAVYLPGRSSSSPVPRHEPPPPTSLTWQR